MKRLYHICFTSHDETMFRDEEDFLHGINALALACIYNDEKVCTFSFQSDHGHFDILVENPSNIVKSFKSIYTQYFNAKYKRNGTLCKRGSFRLEIIGPRHIEACESYILRNAVHHGIASTPYGYHYNSSCCYFSYELGHKYLGEIDFTKYQKGSFLPDNRRFTKSVLMNSAGMVAPSAFLEISLVEKFFGSPRGFNYCMTRLSSEEWANLQEKDDNGMSPVTLETIESNYSKAYESMYEKGRFAMNRMTDIDVCELIDHKYVPKYRAQSYCHLTEKQKLSIFQELLSMRACTKTQLRRCLAL